MNGRRTEPDSRLAAAVRGLAVCCEARAWSSGGALEPFHGSLVCLRSAPKGRRTSATKRQQLRSTLKRTRGRSENDRVRITATFGTRVLGHTRRSSSNARSRYCSSSHSPRPSRARALDALANGRLAVDRQSHSDPESVTGGTQAPWLGHAPSRPRDPKKLNLAQRLWVAAADQVKSLDQAKSLDEQRASCTESSGARAHPKSCSRAPANHPLRTRFSTRAKSC